MKIKCIHQNQPNAFLTVKVYGTEETFCLKCQEVKNARLFAEYKQKLAESERNSKKRGRIIWKAEDNH